MHENEYIVIQLHEILKHKITLVQANVCDITFSTKKKFFSYHEILTELKKIP